MTDNGSNSILCMHVCMYIDADIFFSCKNITPNWRYFISFFLIIIRLPDMYVSFILPHFFRDAFLSAFGGVINLVRSCFLLSRTVIFHSLDVTCALGNDLSYLESLPFRSVSSALFF